MKIKRQTGILILIIYLLTSVSKYVGNELTEIRNELTTREVHKESNGARYTKTYIADRELSETEWNSLLVTLHKRAEMYTPEASITYDMANNSVTITLPEMNAIEEIFDRITASGQLEFIANRGTGQEEVILTGANILEASVSRVETVTGAGEYQVLIQFDDEGTVLFAEGTKKHLGNSIAIVFDGNILSEPRVTAAITDGRAVITGIGSYEECSVLATFINSGSLNVNLAEATISSVLFPSVSQTSNTVSFIDVCVLK
ncbi:MAG: SecDF P1 head subdomain-containing protein [Acetatifactor sp.]